MMGQLNNFFTMFIISQSCNFYMLQQHNTMWMVLGSSLNRTITIPFVPGCLQPCPMSCLLDGLWTYCNHVCSFFLYFCVYFLLIRLPAWPLALIHYFASSVTADGPFYLLLALPIVLKPCRTVPCGRGSQPAPGADSSSNFLDKSNSVVCCICSMV